MKKFRKTILKLNKEKITNLSLLKEITGGTRVGERGQSRVDALCSSSGSQEKEGVCD